MSRENFGMTCFDVVRARRYTYIGPLLGDSHKSAVLGPRGVEVFPASQLHFAADAMPPEIPLSVTINPTTGRVISAEPNSNGHARYSEASFAPHDEPGLELPVKVQVDPTTGRVVSVEAATELLRCEPTPLLDLVRGLPPGSTVSLEITLPGEQA